MTDLKQPPHNADAERTILGACLMDKKALASAMAALAPADFYRQAHATTFEAMLELFGRGVEVDPVTLKNELQAAGKLGRVGGAAWIASLIDGVPRVTNVTQWAAILRSKAILRKLQTAGATIRSLADEDEDADVLVSRAIAEVLEIAHGSGAGKGYKGPQEVAKAAMQRLDILSRKGINGLATGITEFDEETGGLTSPQLIVIAGRPGHGKSAAATTIAANVTRAGGTVGIVSLEMGHDEVGVRLLAREGQVNPRGLRFDTTGEQMAKLSGPAFAKLASSGIYVDDDPSMTLSKIQARARMLQAEVGLDLLIVDYLQLMSGEGKRYEGRQWEIAAIARGLKNLAKDLSVPVIALSQLSRDVEKRQDKRPVLSDLRESGEIEQASDIVVLLYRPSMHDKRANPEEAEWIVAKHRNGSLVDIKVKYIARFTCFTDPDKGEVPKEDL